MSYQSLLHTSSLPYVFSSHVSLPPLHPPHTSNLVSHSPKASKTSLLRLGWQCFFFFFFFQCDKIKASLHFKQLLLAAQEWQSALHYLFFASVVSGSYLSHTSLSNKPPPPTRSPPAPSPTVLLPLLLRIQKKYFLKCSERLGSWLAIYRCHPQNPMTLGVEAASRQAN